MGKNVSLFSRVMSRFHTDSHQRCLSAASLSCFCLKEKKPHKLEVRTGETMVFLVLWWREWIYSATWWKLSELDCQATRTNGAKLRTQWEQHGHIITRYQTLLYNPPKTYLCTLRPCLSGQIGAIQKVQIVKHTDY